MNIAESAYEVGNALFALIGVFGLTIVGSVATAFGLFKWLGEKWVDQRFKRDLELLRAQHQTELEHLKMRINALLDRATKLHVREFEVLPEMWRRLFVAHLEVRRLVSTGQERVSFMMKSHEDVEAFVLSSSLSKEEQEFVLNARDKEAAFHRIIDWQRYSATGAHFDDARDFFGQNKIFIRPEISDAINSVIDAIVSALVDYRFTLQTKHHVPKDIEAELEASTGKLMATIQSAIQARLWNGADS